MAVVSLDPAQALRPCCAGHPENTASVPCHGDLARPVKNTGLSSALPLTLH